jgi:hypothetical protein
MKIPMLIIASCSFLAFGCSAAAPSSVGSTAGAESSSDKLDGLFEAVGTTDLSVGNSYTFHSDGTYTYAGGCPQDGPGPHCFAITAGSGTWEIKKDSPQDKIVLDDDNGNEDTYYISYGGNTLTFNKTLDGSTAYFFKESWTRDIPIGDVCQDNNGNSLGNCSDSGNFACGEDGTGDNVYTCVPLD